MPNKTQRLAYLATADLQSALQRIRHGVQAAKALADENGNRKRWYAGAIYDLEHIHTAPMRAADRFIRFVQAGRDRRLPNQTCRMVCDGPDGVSERSGFGSACDPHAAVMTVGAEFIVLAPTASTGALSTVAADSARAAPMPSGAPPASPTRASWPSATMPSTAALGTGCSLR